MPEIELGLVLKAYDRTEGILTQLESQSKSVGDAIVGLGKEMEKGGTAGRNAAVAMRDLTRELDANDKAARLAGKAWSDQFDVFNSMIDVGDRVAKSFDRGLKMATQYNVAQIRLTETEENLAEASTKLREAQERVQKMRAEGLEGTKEYQKAIEEQTKAEVDFGKATDAAAKAQDTLNLMMVGFVMQAPSFAKDFMKTGEEIAKFGAQIAHAGGIVPAFMAAMGGMSASVHGFTAALLANPAVLIIGAIVAAVAALALIWHTDFLGMRDDIEAFYNSSVKPVVDALGEVLGEFVDGVLKPLAEAFVWAFQNVIGPVIGWVWDNLVKPVLLGWIEMLKTIIGWIADVIKWIKELIASWESWQPEPKQLEVTMGEAGAATMLPGTIPEGQVGYPYGVPRTGTYRLHKGEVVSRDGAKIHIGSLNVYANDRAGGRAAMRGALDELERRGIISYV